MRGAAGSCGNTAATGGLRSQSGRLPVRKSQVGTFSADGFANESDRGAGDGNRTRTTSLEGWSSTIELRPQRPPERTTDTGSVPSPTQPPNLPTVPPPGHRATEPAHGAITICPSTAPGTVITFPAVFVAVTIGVTAPLSGVLPGDRT